MPQIDHTQFWNDLLNGLSFTTFVVYFIYMAVGALMHFAWDVFTSTKHDRRTPDKFSFLYMVKTSFFRGLFVVGLIFVAITQHERLFGSSPSGLNMWFIGISLDNLVGNIGKFIKGYKGPQIAINK